MADVTIDATEVRELVLDFEQVPAALVRHGIPIIKDGAVSIQRGIRADFEQSGHFKGAARSVSYSIVDGGLGAEIGPENPIASIGIFGGGPWSSRVNPGPGWQQGPGGGGTVRDPREVLLEEAPKITRSWADLAAELLR